MEGMKQVAISSISSDLWNAGTVNATSTGYRAANNYNTNAAQASTYDHWDMPAIRGLQSQNPPNDSWLAPRFPEMDTATGLNRPVWRGLTAPLVGREPHCCHMDILYAG